MAEEQGVQHKKRKAKAPKTPEQKLLEKLLIEVKELHKLVEDIRVGKTLRN